MDLFVNATLWPLVYHRDWEPLMVIQYIKYLGIHVGSMVVKFQDNTKISFVVDSEEGCFRLQNIINELFRWQKQWQGI